MSAQRNGIMNHAGARKRGWKALTRANPNTRWKRGGLLIGFSGYLIGTAPWMKVRFGYPEIAKIQTAGREDLFHHPTKYGIMDENGGKS